MNEKIEMDGVYRPADARRGVRVRVTRVDAVGMVTFRSIGSGRRMPRCSEGEFRRRYERDAEATQ